MSSSHSGARLPAGKAARGLPIRAPCRTRLLDSDSGSRRSCRRQSAAGCLRAARAARPATHSWSRTSLRDRSWQLAQSAEDAVGGKAERIDRRAGTVDPPDAKAERFRALRVPAVRRDEADVARRSAEPLHGKLIDVGG